MPVNYRRASCILSYTKPPARWLGVSLFNKMTREAGLDPHHRPVTLADRSSIFARARHILLRLLVLPIDLYSILVSPLLLGHYGPACRFEPHCSAYARAAILQHGPLRGLPIALRRLLRCRPGGGRGFDPLPPERSVRA